MNAEIVVRLTSTFPSNQAASPALDEPIEQLLKDLPTDLTSQYGLYLYRTELQRANSQLEAEQANFSTLWTEHQGLIAKAAPPGVLVSKKEAITSSQRTIGELKNQVRLIEQTIGAIHFHRKLHGLPELRALQELSVSVQTR